MAVRHFILCLGLLILFGRVLSADPITINPSGDGSLYTCSDCNVVDTGAYVLVADGIQGDVKFSTAAIPEAIDQALLELNPYGLPLWAPDVDVYGFTSGDGSVDASDVNAGVYLGTLVLPADLGSGEDAFFDVTSFVEQNAGATFLGFNLRSADGPDVFSSTSYNYGQPPQLDITATPEPCTLILFLSGIGALASRRGRWGGTPQTEGDSREK